jgi:glycosyltransferase involved in cell wall biosynthesis
MKILPRGVDRDFTKLDTAIRERVREQWFAEERPTLLYAGRLGQEKNLDFLLRLFQELRASGQDVRLLLAGDGPAYPALAQQAAGSTDIVFLGRLDRKTLRACYALADVFVFPSTTDTFGMAVLEAQVCGLPAVVAAAGGPPEIIQHGRSGYALPADDPAMWTQTLARLLDARRLHPEEYARWRTEIQAEFLPAQDWTVLLDDIMGPAANTGETAPVAEAAPTGARTAWPHRLYGAVVPPVTAPAGQPEGANRLKSRQGARKSPDLRVWSEPKVPTTCKSDTSLVNS